MAIFCRICETEIEALHGVRCRKCRQLVCKDCVESKWDEGVICKDCVRQDAARESGIAAAPEPLPLPPSPDAPEQPGGQGQPETPAAGVKRNPLMVPVWAWAVVGLALGILFLVIVYTPRIKLDRLEAALHSRNPAVAEKAGRELSAMGGQRAYEIILAALESEREGTRIMAIHALGYWSGSEATELLESLAYNMTRSDDIRSAATLALERQRQIRKDSGVPR